MQFKQNKLIFKKDDNTSNNFEHRKKKDYILENKKQNLKKDYKDLIGKSLDIENIKNILLEHIP